MKTHLVVWLVGAAAVPFAVQGAVGTFDPGTLDEDSDLMKRAAEIAQREFAMSANLTVEEVYVTDHRMGAFGERIRPDPGYAFHAARVRVENTGKVDLAVSTWHFSGIDDAGSDRGVQLGGAHEDFDASRLGRGHSRSGVIMFELQGGTYLTGVSWQGELAEANATVPAYPYP